MNIEKEEFADYQANKNYNKLALIFLGLLLSILVGCSTTEVVPIGKDTFMVAKRNAGGVFSSANAMKPELFREANAFCVEQQKQLVVVEVITLDGMPFRPPRHYAEIQFRCEAESATSQKKEGVNKPTPINLFDWNGDGKKDIISGSKSGHVFVYLNTGTNQEPVFDTAFKIPYIIVEGESDPCIVDWNDDGNKDLLVGQGSGEVFKFMNRGTNQQPLFAAAQPSDEQIFVEEQKINNGDLDVGSYSSPAMVDWNGDGKKDLVVGNQKGAVYVFLNIGYGYELSSDGIKTDITVPKKATPYIVDWNNDGKFDVVSGSSDGRVYIFINEGDSKNPKFNKPQTVHVNNKELKLPNSTSVIALDWDDDGKIDLLVSHKAVTESDVRTGHENIIPTGIYLLLNTGTKERPEFKELKKIKGIFRDDTVL